jgi:hypothetical protein
MSRRASSDALGSYRAQQEQQRFAVPPQSAAAPRTPPSFYTSPPQYNSYNSWYDNRARWYGGAGWAAPSYVYRSAPRFGIWDGLFLWFMLDTLTRPGHSDFFYNHQDDPGYGAWRAEANRLAADNAELKAKLDGLDQRLASNQGQPRDPNYLPSDARPDVALAADRVVGEATSPSGGWTRSLAPVLIGGAILFLLWRWRRRNAPI